MVSSIAPALPVWRITANDLKNFTPPKVKIAAQPVKQRGRKGIEMTDEERQRQIDFSIEQQAQFAVNMGLLREAQARTDATVAQLVEQIGQTGRQVAQMTAQQTHMNEVVAVIAAAQQHTDERLSALIDIVQGGLGRQS